jgi:hypothetical protein
MTDKDPNRSLWGNRVHWWLATLLFLLSWAQLLWWGRREWHVFDLDHRFFLVGTAIVYPWPWLLMISGRQAKIAFFCLFAYIALQASVMLMTR